MNIIKTIFNKLFNYFKLRKLSKILDDLIKEQMELENIKRDNINFYEAITLEFFKED